MHSHSLKGSVSGIRKGYLFINLQLLKHGIQFSIPNLSWFYSPKQTRPCWTQLLWCCTVKTAFQSLWSTHNFKFTLRLLDLSNWTYRGLVVSAVVQTHWNIQLLTSLCLKPLKHVSVSAWAQYYWQYPEDDPKQRLQKWYWVCAARVTTLFLLSKDCHQNDLSSDHKVVLRCFHCQLNIRLNVNMCHINGYEWTTKSYGIDPHESLPWH